jgi:O-antigen/teichoic acid export membrane protein
MAKNYLYNLLLTLANLLFPVFSFPYASRILGPEGIGQVQFVFSFAQYFTILASTGIPIYGLKEIARLKDNQEQRSAIFSELMVIYFVSCVLLSIIYAGIVGFIPYFSANSELYWTALIMVFLSFTNLEWLYSGLEEFGSIAVRSVAFKIIGLALLYLLVKTRSDYWLYLCLLMFSYLGNNVLSLFLLKGRVKLKLVNLQFKKHFSPLLYILATTLAASLYTEMDTVLLGFLSAKKTVGLYTAAVKLSKISIPFVTAMNVILLPKIGKEFGDQNMANINKILKLAFGFLIFFGVPIALGLYLLAPEFIELFSGSEFLPAVGSMRLLSVLPVIIGFAHLLLFMILVPSNNNKFMLTSVLGGMCTSLTLNILLVPRWQEMGSAVANISAEVVVTAFYYYFIWQRLKIRFNWYQLLQAVCCALTFVPVVWLIRQLYLPLYLFVLVAVAGCALVYVVAQLLLKNEIVHEILTTVKSGLLKRA